MPLVYSCSGDLHFYMRHSYCGRNGGSAGAWASSGSAELGQQNEASAATAAAAAGGQQQQTQQGDERVTAAGGAEGVRRLSSDSAVSTASTSSSSGVDSCGSVTEAPIAAAAAAAAAAALGHSPHQQQQHQGRPNERVSDSSASSSSVGGTSPVKNALKTLPRLQLNRSSFEGVRDNGDLPAKPYAGSTAAAQGHYHSPADADAGSAFLHQHQQQQYAQPYQQQYQQQYGVMPGRSRLGGTPMPADVAATIQWQRQQQQHSFLDPEHLICNGMGGAFMHPTHVFSYSRFAVLDDEAATATAAIYSSSGPHRWVHGMCVVFVCKVNPMSWRYVLSAGYVVCQVGCGVWE